MNSRAPIVYNVTAKLAHEIQAPWLEWMQQEHIPAMLATGCFFDAVLWRLKDMDETDGPTFTVQYFARSRAEYERYLSEHSPRLRQAGFDKWGHRFIAFRTVMELVN
ncbi:hypothetical protein GCM10027051_19220 [Niabella terrae]